MSFTLEMDEKRFNENRKKQLDRTPVFEEDLRTKYKYTNADLYSWMQNTPIPLFYDV